MREREIRRMQAAAEKLGEELLGRPVPPIIALAGDTSTDEMMGISSDGRAPDSGSGGLRFKSAIPRQSEGDGIALETISHPGHTGDDSCFCGGDFCGP